MPCVPTDRRRRRPAHRFGTVLRWPAALLILALLFLLLLAPNARADVAGQDDPRFALALGRWLADDDATALPEIAELASGGNRAAQVLLTLIDVTPSLQGPWLASRPRAERVALMRAPGGLSGRAWMETAAEDTPLARLWLRRWDARDTGEITTALAFAALGEARAARETLLARASRGRGGFAAVADDALYPPSLRYLVWREWDGDGSRHARIGAEIEALLPGDPQISFWRARPVTISQRDEWLARAPPAGTLRTFCAAVCPGTYRSCARAAYALLDYPRLTLLGTPSETLIPPATWEASPRGIASILRRAPRSPHTLREIARIDRCTASALAAEAARFVR